MPITVNVPDFSEGPLRSDPTDYDNRVETRMVELEALPPVLNALSSEMNTLSSELNTLEQNVGTIQTDITTKLGLVNTAKTDSESARDVAEQHKNSAKAAAAAAGSAAGLPELVGKAGKFLGVSDDELSVAFLAAGAKIVPVGVSQSVEVASGLTSVNVAVLPMGNGCRYSTDGLSFSDVPAAGVIENITASLHVAGADGFGNLDERVDATDYASTYNTLSFLPNGDRLQTTNTQVKKFGGITGALIQLDNITNPKDAFSDGTDIYVLTSSPANIYKYPGGDLTVVPTLMFAPPGDTYRMAFDGTNLLTIGYDVVSIHSGITATVSSTVTLDALSGGAFSGNMAVLPNGDLVVHDRGYYKIYVFDGISSTLKKAIDIRNDEFAGGATAVANPLVYGIGYDPVTAALYILGTLDAQSAATYLYPLKNDGFGALVFGV
jgi:hypothetical protein